MTDDSGVVYEEPEKEEPLTPDGNATLGDDFGGNGTYALIDKNENRDRQIRKPRPSVRAQLAQDNKRTAPKKAAAKTKNHGLEV